MRQGCVLAPSLFCAVMDAVMRETQPSGLRLDNSFFSGFDYADDVALVDDSFDSLSETLSRMKTVSSRFGLKINWSKTKIQNIGWGTDPSITHR